jgi:molybdenum cofactor guanylyltransferase
MKRLGAIIAGGHSTRFGGDKAAALIAGRALIDHVAAALHPQVEALIVCGRDWPGLATVADDPAPDLGPLGGLCAALRHAVAHGFDIVLTAGCDSLPVPDLRALGGPAVVAGQRLFGVWPVAFADQLSAHLATTTDRSVRHWIAVSGAREIALPGAVHNINTRRDLDLYTQMRGLAA